MIRIVAKEDDITEAIKDWRLPGESLRTLLLLYENRNSTFSSIAELNEALGVSMSTFYRTIAVLRKLGYVEERKTGEGKLLVLKANSLVNAGLK